MNDRNDSALEGSGRKWKVVYTIVEGRGDKKFWLRVGVGFENRDGSFNIRLDAVPTNGTLHMRDPDPAEQRGGRDAGDYSDGGGNGSGNRRGARNGQAGSLQEVQ